MFNITLADDKLEVDKQLMDFICQYVAEFNILLNPTELKTGAGINYSINLES